MLKLKVQASFKPILVFFLQKIRKLEEKKLVQWQMDLLALQLTQEHWVRVYKLCCQVYFWMCLDRAAIKDDFTESVSGASTAHVRGGTGTTNVILSSLQQLSKPARSSDFLFGQVLKAQQACTPNLSLFPPQRLNLSKCISIKQRSYFKRGRTWKSTEETSKQLVLLYCVNSQWKTSFLDWEERDTKWKLADI